MILLILYFRKFFVCKGISINNCKKSLTNMAACHCTSAPRLYHICCWHLMVSYNLMIFSASNVPIGGIQVLFWHQKQWSPPLGSDLPWARKCSVTGQFTLDKFSSQILSTLLDCHLKTHNFHLQLCAIIHTRTNKIKSWNNFTVILAQNTRIRKLGTQLL